MKTHTSLISSSIEKIEKAFDNIEDLLNTEPEIFDDEYSNIEVKKTF